MSRIYGNMMPKSSFFKNVFIEIRLLLPIMGRLHRENVNGMLFALQWLYDESFNNESHIVLTSAVVYHMNLYANLLCVRLQNH